MLSFTSPPARRRVVPPAVVQRGHPRPARPVVESGRVCDALGWWGHGTHWAQPARARIGVYTGYHFAGGGSLDRSGSGGIGELDQCGAQRSSIPSYSTAPYLLLYTLTSYHHTLILLSSTTIHTGKNPQKQTRYNAGMKLRLLDLFCGAGGAARGYADAGFEVVGVDIEPQKNYPFEFYQADAMTYPLDGFDVIHASPPCQKYSAATRHLANESPRLIEPLRERLRRAGITYVIENVPGAPLIEPITLCGLSFGLNVKRHRLFESTVSLTAPPCVPGHPGDWFVIFGHEVRSRRHGHAAGRKNKLAEGRLAMRIDWMTRGELSEAIPPAYTEHVGRQLLLQ